MIVILALLVALAILGPLFGKDSRDGRDWAPSEFPYADDPPRSDPPRSADNPASPAAVPAAADRRRTVPAAC
jgi:hypothetical protein